MDSVRYETTDSNKVKSVVWDWGPHKWVRLVEVLRHGACR